MADNLPLIPGKSGVVCADVRPVLREIFRELDYLPPLVEQPSRKNVAEDGDGELACINNWVEKYSSECKEIALQEGELKLQHAKKISNEPLPNIYKIYSPTKKMETWKKKRVLLKRDDLMPPIELNAVRDASLWIKNIFNRSSCDVSALQAQGSRIHHPVRQLPPGDYSLQSLSIGEAIVYQPPPPAPLPQSQPPPEYVVCVPAQLDFINFTIGHLHTQSIRIINVSKFEVRLSIKPPSRRELDIEICGSRGLTVTSGSAVQLRVHFRARDVRVLRDVLLVRVSLGRSFSVPITCYMQPPLLHILVPSITSILTCTRGEERETNTRFNDVLELGAKLLGDVHDVFVLLNCEARHAAFFLLTEDAWLSFCLDAVTERGSLIAGPFVVSPAWWRGGGSVRARAWCRAPHAGAHVAATRVLATTAMMRPLHLLADSLYFKPDHFTLQAHEKDYDICSDDDPDCEYYVNLGTAFPGRSLSANVQLVNHSPIIYSYYWSVRPWGVCSCWDDEKELASKDLLGPEDNESRLCIGAKEAKAGQNEKHKLASASAQLVRVEASRGQVAARSACAVQVRVPNVGVALGVQRAVLMLVLKNIPKESFPFDYDPKIVTTETVESDPIPGVAGWTREVCEVVCLQMEVWWEVAPVRFVLDPPELPLFHSRRIQSIDIQIRATQLFGSEIIYYSWKTPEGTKLEPGRLTPANSNAVDLQLPLPSVPNDYPEFDVITMEAKEKEWESHCKIVRKCATRHPSLQAARTWLGVVPPGAHLHAKLQILNETYQDICWWATPWRWWGENPVRPACAGRAPCGACRERACTCALLRPTRGALKHGEGCNIIYDVNAPERDGCVVTLVQAVRTGADVALVHSAAGSHARASLLAYRVLAPRLVLRVLPCRGDKITECKTCSLDQGMLKSKRGTAVLRPQSALNLARRTCYRLRFTNLTPLPTSVQWEPPLEGEDILKVTFVPNEFKVGKHEEVEIGVILEARKVCERRIFVLRAHVDQAYKPIYLVIDTAIAGLEIICEVPLGGGEKSDSCLVMKRTQREIFPWDSSKENTFTPEEIFAEEDRKRSVQKENICFCKSEAVYIPPVKRPQPPKMFPEDYSSIEIICEPPPLTQVCTCFAEMKANLPEHTEPYCLQFKNLHIRKVGTKTLVLRNDSILTAHWSTTVRRWPRHHTRTLESDQWASDVRAPGVVIECAPAGGVLAARARVNIDVRVYADCWGLYYDQLLIKIDNVAPIVLDIWIEAVGQPLLLAFKPNELDNELPTLWMSASDTDRILRIKNTSRSLLNVCAYVLKEHENLHDAHPFRLYLRFIDAPPLTCPCSTAFDSDYLTESISSSQSTLVEELGTGIILYLAPDYGLQEDNYFKVTPEIMSVPANTWVEWDVKMDVPLHSELAPTANLLLQALPDDNYGPSWFRPTPPVLVVRLQQAAREGRLQASCTEVRVKVCALDLPVGDTMRIRKRFRIKNVLNGPLEIAVSTKPPWCVVEDEGRAKCGAGCNICQDVVHRSDQRELHLPPRSSSEVCVEVRIHTVDVWPTKPDSYTSTAAVYPERKIFSTPLNFFDDDNVLLTVPLILDMECPVLKLNPRTMDFGFVTDGDTRKMYFRVSHSSNTVTLDLVTYWDGGPEFQLWPPHFRLPPGASERVYVQYTARWFAAPVEGWARVSVGQGGRGAWSGRGARGARGAGGAGSAAGSWCCAAVQCRATPTRDFKCHVTRHDYTDDTHLLPADVIVNTK